MGYPVFIAIDRYLAGYIFRFSIYAEAVFHAEHDQDNEDLKYQNTYMLIHLMVTMLPFSIVEQILACFSLQVNGNLCI